MSLSYDQIFELETLLEKIETIFERCCKGILKNSEAMGLCNQLWTQALSIPEKDSDEWRMLDSIRGSHNAWWKSSKSGYTEKQECEHFSHLRDAIKKILEENEREFLHAQKRSRNQLFIAAGEKYKAQKAIYDIMIGALKSLSVVDQYLDEDIFDYLESLNHSIYIKLLTGDTKPIFKKLYLSFAMERGNIEARVTKECHDRFIIVDEVKVFHLGASINYAGNKAFMIQAINDCDELKKFIAEFSSWWLKGKLIE